MQIKQLILIIGVIFFSVVLQTATAQSIETLPTLRGDEAVNQLKQTGQHESLMDAVRDARKKDGQSVEPQPEDAIGQSAKLIATDGAANDQFGYRVAISGNTAIVGAYLDDVGANSDQGSAYVFVRSGTVWTQQQQLTALDGGASDQFGYSVAISGDTVIVGANSDDVGANADQGSAYVFVRSGGVWTQQQQLTALDGAASDLFGYSVAISGDTAIVGAINDDVGANADRGSAYVFVRSGVVWTQQQQLTATGGAAGDNFGNSVAISGDTAIVGAYLDDIGANSDRGAAYVFVRSGVVWTQQAQLTATGGTANDQFANSVSISGDTAIIGASNDDVGANLNQGSAYVFTRTGVVWTQQQQLTASNGRRDDWFGYSVSISGDTAIVGAIGYNVGSILDLGSAYVFVRSGGVWTQQQQLTASDGAASDQFGWSVAISGDYMIVGAYFDDVGANTDQGSAYVYSVLGTNWTQAAQKVAAGGAAGDSFGYSVAISGDTAIVGAPFDDVGANSNQGSVYIFVRSGSAWTQQQQLTATGGAAGDFFGYSVAISGDTAIVGAPGDDVGANFEQGSAYTFARSGVVWTQQAQLSHPAGAQSDFFGESVAISRETAIVGSSGDDFGVSFDEGSAHVFIRSGGVWTREVSLTAADGSFGNQFGYSVAISGDTAIIGANKDDVGANVNQGSAYVFTRTGVVWTQQQQLTASDGAADDNFGESVAISGDTAIVGAYLDDVGANSDQGSAYVFVRSGTVWTQQAQLAATGGAANDEFGLSVAISGETAIVGAYLDDVGANSDQGSAYVFVRSGTVWTQQQQVTATGGAAGDQFGFSVGISGDKIIVGAPFSDVSVNVPLAPQAADQGAMFVFVNNIAPTAANVSVGGRVLTADGFGVRNAIVTLTKPSGETVTVRTGTFGYYRFDDVEAGQTYIIGVLSKRYVFMPRVINVSDELMDLDLIEQQP